jgi:trk system potassium uptake protein TrkH
MRIYTILRMLGLLLMLFSLTLLPPIAVSLIYQDQILLHFVSVFLGCNLAGGLLWLMFRQHRATLKIRDGFLIVTSAWAMLSVCAAIPFDLCVPNMTLTDALFEATSGLTTTGASVIEDLSRLPYSLLYYRQQLHLLGGMGIVVLAIAIFPMLGIGGMQLYQAEMVGPTKTQKLKPRMQTTAKALWSIYLGLMCLCAIAYHLAGMSWFDAIGESFSTVSTGGFAIHNGSFAYYDSTLIDLIAVLFMLLGALNFSLHFLFLKRRDGRVYWQDPECRAYLKWILIMIAIGTATLCFYYHDHFLQSLEEVFFTVVSFATTTGLTNTSFHHWPLFLPLLMLFLGVIGGCSGSTSGGVKVMRFEFIKREALAEIKRLIHPQVTMPTKIGASVLSYPVARSIWRFIAATLLLSMLIVFILLATGISLDTAFAAMIACLFNIGASIAGVTEHFNHLPVVAKWTLTLAMIAGRLEIFTVFVLLSPHYWKK